MANPGKKNRSSLKRNRNGDKLSGFSLFLVAAGLAVFTFVVFQSVLSFGYVNLDDNRYIAGNMHIRAGLTSESIKWAFSTLDAEFWHPLTWLSYMFDRTFFGAGPRGHHLTNLLLHTANTVILFVFLYLATSALWRSAFVAALFAVHPLHIESVVWIAERKDVLSTLFWMLTLLAYLRYSIQPSLRRYILVFVVFVLGLMAKPMLVTLPFVLLLMDYWPLKRFEKNNRRSSIVSLFLEKVPLIVFAVAAGAVTIFAQRKDVAKAAELIPFKWRFFNAIISYPRYIGKMFWPANLSAFYPHPFDSIAMWQVLAAAVILAAITILVFMYVKRYPYLSVGWLWYFGTLLPVIGLIQIGEFSIADRYTYIPLIGLFIMIAWSVGELIVALRYRQILLGSACAAVILILAAVSYKQMQNWRDSRTLFTHCLNVTKNNWLMHNNLATVLSEGKRYREAIEHYRLSVSIKNNRAEVLNNLSWMLAVYEKTTPETAAEAVGYAERACYLTDYNQPVFLDTLAVAYATAGRHEDAERTWQRALSLAKGTASFENIAEHIRVFHSRMGDSQ